MTDNELTGEDIDTLRVKAARDTVRRHYTFGATEGAKVFDMARRYATEMPTLRTARDRALAGASQLEGLRKADRGVVERQSAHIVELEAQVERMRAGLEAAERYMSSVGCSEKYPGRMKVLKALADLPNTSKAVEKTE